MKTLITWIDSIQSLWIHNAQSYTYSSKSENGNSEDCNCLNRQDSEFKWNKIRHRVEKTGPEQICRVGERVDQTDSLYGVWCLGSRIKD